MNKFIIAHTKAALSIVGDFLMDQGYKVDNAKALSKITREGNEVYIVIFNKKRKTFGVSKKRYNKNLNLDTPSGLYYRATTIINLYLNKYAK